MKRILFIYNPKAGKGLIRSQLSYILEELAKGEGTELVVHPTRAAQDASRITQQRGRQFDLIVCCGGDGTLDEVVTGMQRGGFVRRMGYIPTGSTNDFARSLGIPRNMRRAARNILEGIAYPCDVGHFNDDYFVYVAAFGAFTDVSYRTSQDWKNMLGHLAYILEGVKSLPELKSWKLRFESSECSGEGDFIYGMITNSNSVGGLKGITGKDVTLNDGVFEVTLIRMPGNFVEWPAIIDALLNGKENRFIVSFKTARVEFFSEESISWTRDGEYGGTHSHVVIENLPKSLPILISENQEEAWDDQEEEAEEAGE